MEVKRPRIFMICMVLTLNLANCSTVLSIALHDGYNSSCNCIMKGYELCNSINLWNMFYSKNICSSSQIGKLMCKVILSVFKVHLILDQ